MDNMKLWNLVCETDPSWTEPVQLGGRKFTTIDAQRQIKRATELWGPYGLMWGVRHLKWDYISDKDGNILAITLDAEFFYPASMDVVPVDGLKETVLLGAEGSFEIGSDMPWKPNGETKKKLLTDVTTKALSKLGFNSDVFEGKFDDNRYVSEMRQKFASEAPQSAPKSGVPPTTSKVSAAATGPAKPVSDPFLEAVRNMMKDPKWNEDTYYRILGGMGFENINEVTKETDRRKLAAALRREMGIEK